MLLIALSKDYHKIIQLYILIVIAILLLLLLIDSNQTIIDKE
jgi:hypothetical protein